MQTLQLKAEQKQPNILSIFLGKSILVECEEGLTLKGKLIRYELGFRKGRYPTILVLQNGNRKLVVRSWKTIKKDVCL